MRTWRACSWLLAAGLLLCSSAHANSLDGLTLPVESIHQDAGVLGIESNPALLGFLRGSEATILHAETGDKLTSGGGLYAGTRLWRGVHLGGDVLVFRDGGSRMGMGLAFSPKPSFSMGAAWHTVFDDEHGKDGLHSIDLGLVSRPASWLSLAATAERVNRPSHGDVILSRRYQAGALVRPGTSRFAFGADVAVEEDTGEMDVIGSIFTQPIPGLHLGVTVRAMPRDDGTLGFVGGFQLGANWGGFGVESGVTMALPDGGEARLDQTHVALRFSKQPRVSLSRSDDGWVRITLGSIAERSEGTVLGAGRPTQVGVLRYLRALARDSHVGGVLIQLRGYRATWAQAQEIRAAIQGLRAEGKRVHVHFDQVRNVGYYVASAADRIMADPAGGAWLLGLSSTTLFYAELLDQFGVDAQVVRFGRYKSFPESFMSGGPSPELNEVKDAILGGLEAQLVAGISDGRKVSEEAALALLHAGPYTASELMEKGLIDALAHDDEIEKIISNAEGRPVRLQKRYRPDSPSWDVWGGPDAVAVLTVEGNIVDGRSGSIPLLGRPTIGSRTFLASLEKLVGNPRVKAIVIRVNSPGGSALASDQMHRGVLQARKKKPVIISMGGVAASGGYFLAAAGERIFAEPGTVTGSIGIFTTKFSFGQLMGWLGVKEHVWKRHDNADFFALSRPWSEAQQALLSSKLKMFYDRFLAAVAAGREMTVAEVDAVAQGRVWLGSQALEKGLVDELGGLNEAIAFAAGRAGLEPGGPWTVSHLPRRSWQAALKAMLMPRVEADAEAEAPSAEERLLERALAGGLGSVGELLAYEPAELLTLMPVQITIE